MPNTQAQIPESGFLRISQIIGHSSFGTAAIVPVSRATLWLWVKMGRFPKPIKLGPNTTAWKAEDVRGWISDQGNFAKKHVHPTCSRGRHGITT